MRIFKRVCIKRKVADKRIKKGKEKNYGNQSEIIKVHGTGV